MTKMAKVKKIKSLNDLLRPEYHRLAIIAAENLGWRVPTISRGSMAGDAYHYLCQQAAETTEAGVRAEVNFCIPCL